jgi:hypothetical protein
VQSLQVLPVLILGNIVNKEYHDICKVGRTLVMILECCVVAIAVDSFANLCLRNLFALKIYNGLFPFFLPRCHLSADNRPVFSALILAKSPFSKTGFILSWPAHRQFNDLREVHGVNAARFVEFVMCEDSHGLHHTIWTFEWFVLRDI